MEVKATADEVVGIYKEVTGFWSNFSNFFKPKKKPAPKPVAQKKKQQYITVDETKVMADVVKHLTEFFRLQEQLAAHIRQEEEKSRSVYDPNANLMEAALNRVMAQDQMAALEVTIRETMVYQSPPEMGALYSKVFDMRNVIREEQEQARLAQEAKERQRRWRQRQAQEKVRLQTAYLIATTIVMGYLYLWFLILIHWRKAKWGF
jgi:hypothetical protein